MSTDDHLTALDATFLELEQADDGALMHIGAALVFDPLPGSGTPAIGQVREHLERRLDLLPRYRQKLSVPRTGGLSWPSWEPDPRFDIDAHVRHATLPSPGDENEFMAWISDFYSHRLDRSRPLWEITLLDGLASGGWALVWKTHHCLVDGVGSVDVVDLLLDSEPAPREPPAPPGARLPASDEPRRGWLPHAPVPVRQATNTGRAAARAGAHVLMHPREALERSRGMIDLLVRDELIAAPRSSLNVPIGATRRIEAVHIELEEMQKIRAALGGSVNDVALCAATGGLRAMLLERGEDPPQRGLRAMVPVNIRREAEHGELGNKVSSLFVELPVAEPDLVSRYGLVRAEADRRKAGGQALAAATVTGLTELAPPVLHATLARSLYAKRLFNVTITNVPASPQRLYAFGAPMVDLVPIVPLAAEHAVGIAVVSYAGRVTFGLYADRASVPDLDVLKDGIAASLFELATLATRRRRRTTAAALSRSRHAASARRAAGR
jgi:diacylglycerol O-acyltransferase / wax synthase